MNTTMRGLMALIENQSDNHATLDRLADLVAAWIENDPLTSTGYSASKKRIATQILRLDGVAAQFRTVASPILYRAFAINRKARVQLMGNPWNTKIKPVGLTITPRGSDLLASWTVDIQYAYEHASQFEDAVIIKYPTKKLDVFLSIDLLAQAVDGLDAIEGEVLVRPTAITITAQDVIESED